MKGIILAGGSGTISVTANVAPAAMAAMCNAAVAGEESEAHRLDEPLRALHDKLFVEANPIPVKWALQEMGRIQGGKLATDEVSSRAEALGALADGCVARIRGVLAELRPYLLDDLGLGAALRYQARRFEVATGIVCDLDLEYEDEEAELDPGRRQGLV